MYLYQLGIFFFLFFHKIPYFYQIPLPNQPFPSPSVPFPSLQRLAATETPRKYDRRGSHFLLPKQALSVRGGPDTTFGISNGTTRQFKKIAKIDFFRHKM